MMNRLQRKSAQWSDEDLCRVLENGAYLVGKDALLAIQISCEAARRIRRESPAIFLASEACIKAGAQALHADWFESHKHMWSIIKPEYQFPWVNLSPGNQKAYIRSSQIVLLRCAELLARPTPDHPET